MNRVKPLAVRFQKLYVLEPRSGCWLWQGETDRHGYGQINLGATSGKRKRRGAHIVGYELHRGAVPDGLELDHLCRNPLCVNPDHLEPVTHRDNVLRGISPGAMATRNNMCMRGHLFTDTNTYWSRGQRWCLECRRMRDRKRRPRKA